jgi:fumarate hydratase class II
MSDRMRSERDSLGEVRVPEDALYGAQTQRAVDNFRISGETMPTAFLTALALLKREAARTNGELGLLPPSIARAIAAAADEVIDGQHSGEFPVDVFQTGSGTSSNMNMNEVLARLASRSTDEPVHPNDHVNRCQSSNDVVPSAIQLSAAMLCHAELLPALQQLELGIAARARECGAIVKTGRTHLMDAMPLRLDQELGAWARQIHDNLERLSAALPALCTLPLGGTAVGTGVNAHPEFASRVSHSLAQALSLPLRVNKGFRNLGSQDVCVDFSGRLNSTATSLMKIANDLRWMNSGPLSGLGELQLPTLQPGSSIMPGKVNPVIPEAVAMVCAQVTGNHVTITLAGQSGNFQLNVMLPLIAKNLAESITLLANGSRALADKAIAGFRINERHLAAALAQNPVLVTALNERIGYDAGAAIAKRALAEGRSILEIAREATDIPEAELQTLLDPLQLTRGSEDSQEAS